VNRPRHLPRGRVRASFRSYDREHQRDRRQDKHTGYDLSGASVHRIASWPGAIDKPQGRGFARVALPNNGGQAGVRSLLLQRENVLP
jgi:hypothetical protein